MQYPSRVRVPSSRSILAHERLIVGTYTSRTKVYYIRGSSLIA